MKSIIFIFFFFTCADTAFSQEGSLKNVIIQYDTTYELNNMHKSSAISEVYVEEGLKMYVYDGPRPHLLYNWTKEK